MSDTVTTNVYVKTWINYNNLLNKPTINNVELVGNLSLNNLGIQGIMSAGNAITLTNNQINVIVDNVLSEESENPVQNKVVKEAIDSKQDTLNATQMFAINSGITPNKVTQIATNTEDITTINSKIPAQATSENQLADKSFVNSAVATNSAFFIGTFDSLEDLEAYSGPLTNNDYAFVTEEDTAGNTIYNRYKYTTATTPASWQFEYAISNIAFTPEQWAAINSGITSTLVTQIGTNQNNITSLQNNKLDTSAAAELYVAITQKGSANGVATLDETSKVPLEQLPVDDALSSTSENPLQNKVIYDLIGDIEPLLHNINSGNN